MAPPLLRLHGHIHNVRSCRTYHCSQGVEKIILAETRKRSLKTGSGLIPYRNNLITGDLGLQHKGFFRDCNLVTGKSLWLA